MKLVQHKAHRFHELIFEKKKTCQNNQSAAKGHCDEKISQFMFINS
ncbi:hypothetical protein SFJ1713_3456 [Shigella flexneri SFJ17B]|nr:hypothetical protein SFK671_3590 [Shigella flexneri K-671]EGJ83403.1 hypothetical protein SF434370_3198 [Shigella flexneri 4343-70]EGM60172.1 hypothetical protein SFJ1713_3456 [Shigella flexneri SFJ17B]EIQ05591.1 hypothetical protein SF285071_3560 [Shigella flexneri 2850-71]